MIILLLARQNMLPRFLSCNSNVKKIDDGPFLWKEINGYVGTEDECTG